MGPRQLPTQVAPPYLLTVVVHIIKQLVSNMGLDGILNSSNLAFARSERPEQLVPQFRCKLIRHLDREQTVQIMAGRIETVGRESIPEQSHALPPRCLPELLPQLLPHR